MLRSVSMRRLHLEWNAPCLATLRAIVRGEAAMAAAVAVAVAAAKERFHQMARENDEVRDAASSNLNLGDPGREAGASMAVGSAHLNGGSSHEKLCRPRALLNFEITCLSLSLNANDEGQGGPQLCLVRIADAAMRITVGGSSKVLADCTTSRLEMRDMRR
eukprot:6178248-Pleurochrysis_carterae.AAC.3